MRKWTWAKSITILLFLLPIAFGGCEGSCESNESPVEKAGDKIEDAADEAGDAIEDAGDKAGQRPDFVLPPLAATSAGDSRFDT